MDTRELVKIAKEIKRRHVLRKSIGGDDVCEACWQQCPDTHIWLWPCDARMLADSIINTLKRIRNDPQ